MSSGSSKGGAILVLADQEQGARPSLLSPRHRACPTGHRAVKRLIREGADVDMPGSARGAAAAPTARSIKPRQKPRDAAAPTPPRCLAVGANDPCAKLRRRAVEAPRDHRQNADGWRR